MYDLKKILVYVDDIEKWQECKVYKITSHFEHEEIKKKGIYGRVKVITNNGTELSRLYKIIHDEKDIIEDRCVYFVH